MVRIVAAEEIPSRPQGTITISRGSSLTDEEFVRACRLATQILEVEVSDRIPLLAETIRGSPIRELSLAHLHLRDADIQTLAPALPTMPNLAVLDLKNNDIGSAGFRALAAVIPDCPNLLEIDAAGTLCGVAGQTALVEAFNARRNFNVHHIITAYNYMPQGPRLSAYAWGRGLRYWGPRVLPLLVPGHTPAQVWAWIRDGDHAIMYRVVQFLVELRE